VLNNFGLRFNRSREIDCYSEPELVLLRSLWRASNRCLGDDLRSVFNHRALARLLGGR
jgi:hypothetical protein